MKTRFAFRAALGAFMALALAAVATAEEKSLLTPDGTLYHVQSGLYRSFEPDGTAAQPSDIVIRWTPRPGMVLWESFPHRQRGPEGPVRSGLRLPPARSCSSERPTAFDQLDPVAIRRRESDAVAAHSFVDVQLRFSSAILITHQNVQI
jgi:hypothetical protein